VRLQIRDEAGEVTIQEKIPLSLLQPGKLKTKVTTAATVPTLDGRPVTPELIQQNVNRTVRLEMQVVATGGSPKAGLVFLNSHADRSNPGTITVVLDKQAQQSLKAAGIAAPRTHFEGKTVRVTGMFSRFREQAQIIVSDAKQIEIVR
jgi:hypothetical protein